MSGLTFVPIDAAALDGRHYLVKDDAGYQHSAHWAGDRWEYGAGIPVEATVTQYVPRPQVAA